MKNKNKKNQKETEVKEEVLDSPIEEKEIKKEEDVEKNIETENIEEKLKNVEKERDEWKNKYLRSLAEFENFRKRSFSEKADWIKNANERLILELCDVYDNFQRALENGVKEHQFESFKKGVELISQQIANLLKKENVEKIEALEQEFDPNLHEALAHIPSELEKDKVSAVIQNGYKMNDKVIRIAKVAVSNGEKIVKQDENKEKNTQK